VRTVALRWSLAAVAAVAVLAGVLIRPERATTAASVSLTPAVTPATSGDIPLLTISPALCFVLVAARFQDLVAGAAAGGNCSSLDRSLPTQGGSSTQGHDALMALEPIIGNGDGILEPSDFASIDVDGGQVHQSDDNGNGTSYYDGNLFVLAFVPSTGPVTFSTDRGLMIPAGLMSPSQDLLINPADPAAQTYVCDDQSGTSSGPLVEDADCTGGTSADGVVVGRLRAHWAATTAARGTGTVTVTQGSDMGTTGFSVVGEPETVSITTVETAIQDGAGGFGDCTLPGGASGMEAASATSERSLVLAVARDADGTAVTGALVNWSTDDSDKALLAAVIVPTFDLGTLGFAAPNIICGNTTTGTVTVTASLERNLGGLVVGFDPGATLTSGIAQFSVVSVLDSDGDGCGDDAEAQLGLNPADSWDFYSVPIPALYSASNPLGVTKDSVVSGADAQAVFAYAKIGAKIGTTAYDQDLNDNGINDGVEYDRSFVAPGTSGPPDGVISGSDAQLAFAEALNGLHC
jgi:hypothetical protein